MSSANCENPPEIFTTTSNSNLEDDFAQTKEDFDVSSIPDSGSEDRVTIYYQTPEKGKRGDGFADQQMRDDEIVYGAFIADLTDDGQGDGVLQDNTSTRHFILRRFSTPTTDELIKYINDTDLLGIDDDGSVEEFMTTHQKLEELARIRRVITRNRIPGALHAAENFSGAKNLSLTEAQNASTPLPPGTPLIRDFAIPRLTPFPPSIPNPHNPYTLKTSQALRCTNIPDYQTLQSYTYPSPGIRTMYHYHGVLFRHAVNDIHEPSDDIEEEELQRELSAGEEADDEECLYISGPAAAPVPPRTPILGNRDQNTDNLADIEKIEELEELENGGLFQILPRHLEESRQLKEKNPEGLRTSASSLPAIIPPLTIPIRSLQHLQTPHINPWPVIALAHQIPLFPTHILTTSSLAQLFFHEKRLQELNGYSDSPLDQWALTQHRLFLWVNSGALENGIDEEMRRPESADILLGFDEESSEVWDYEDVEVFARWEGECFGRCLEWVQDAEGNGEGWEGLGLQDDVYDFCGDEEILHRSVSVVDKNEKKDEGSSSSSFISEEYDASDERGEIRYPFLSISLQPQNESQIHDPRLGRVVNIFRARTLQRIGITHQDSSFRQPINHTTFRETGVQAADYARANAMARFEKIAEDSARRKGAAEESAGNAGQLVLSPEGDSGFDGVEMHMRGGAGAGDFSERGVTLR